MLWLGRHFANVCNLRLKELDETHVLANNCDDIALQWQKGVPESMKSMRVTLHIQISSSFNKMVWCLKDDYPRSEEIRCNLEDLRFGCGPLRHQIHFVLSWAIPALRVCLSGGDKKLSSVTVVLLLNLLSSSDATFCDCFSLDCTTLYNNYHAKKAVGLSFQSTVVKTRPVSRPVHFLLCSSIFFYFFKVILSIESFAEQGSPQCNM